MCLCRSLSLSLSVPGLSVCLSVSLDRGFKVFMVRLISVYCLLSINPIYLLNFFCLCLCLSGSKKPPYDPSPGTMVFVTAPCCGRSTMKTDVRPLVPCGCLVCRNCLRTASLQSKVHISNFVGTEPQTGAPIWKIRCPSCGNTAPLTATQIGATNPNALSS